MYYKPRLNGALGLGHQEAVIDQHCNVDVGKIKIITRTGSVKIQ
jgi:hypothetical protein